VPQEEVRRRAARHRDADAAPLSRTAARQPVARRRDLRLAARAERAARRFRRFRFTVRTALAAGVAAVLSASVFVGVAAFGGTTAGTFTLQPGRSATAESDASLTNGQASVTFTLPGRPVGNSLYLGLELRRSNNTMLRAKARVYPDGKVTVDTSKVVNNVETYLGSKAVPVTVGAGTTALALEAYVKGTNPTALGVRAYPAGGKVPDWQYTATGNHGITTSGKVRAWAYLSKLATAPITLQFADLAGKNGDAPAPAPTIPTSAPTTSKPTATATSTATSTIAPPTATTAPPAPTQPTTELGKVVANSGANLDTNYAFPANAVFVSPSGNNGSAGSEGAPVSSIATAISKAPSGGTVVLRGGTYRQGSITVNKTLNIQAFPHEKPVLSGLDRVADWTKSGTAWRTTSWRSPFGQNQFRAEETPSGSAAGKVEQAWRNGSELKQVLTKGELSSGRFWVDPSTLALYVADDPTAATMELSNRARAMTIEAGAANTKIRGLRFTGYAAPHLDDSGQLFVNGAAGTLIENSRFDHSSGAGLKISGPNMVVNRVTVDANGSEGMQGNRNHDSVVKNSQFNNNNALGFLVHLCGGSCTVAGFKAAHTDNLTVTGNAFLGNAANGFWCDLGCTDGTVTGNAVSGAYDGIFWEVSSRGLIADNYVEKADHGGIRVSGSDATTIRDNRVVNNRYQFVVYEDKRSSSTDNYSATLGLSWNVTGLVIRNNEIRSGSLTEKLLETSASSQVASPGMYRETTGNDVTGNEVMMWCPSASSCPTYQSITAWSKASGSGF
jgi:parallel beta-helix repeat protein